MAISYLRLSDGTNTIDFHSDDYRIQSGGLSLPPPVAKPSFVESPFVDGDRLASNRYANRIITISFTIFGTDRDDLQTNVRAIQRLLNDAEKRTTLGYGAVVYLEYQWNLTAGECVYFDVNYGELILPEDFSTPLLWRNYLITNAVIRLNCKPFGRYTNQDIAQETLENEQDGANLNYQDITTVAGHGDVPAKMYLKLAMANATGDKKVWIAKRSGTRQTDDLFIQGEDETSSTDLEGDCTFTDEALVAASGGKYIMTAFQSGGGGAGCAKDTEIARHNYDFATPPRGQFRVLIMARIQGSPVETLRPDAAGDECNISSGCVACPNHFTCVDEAVTDENTTVVYSINNDTWQRDLYEIDDSAGAGGISKIIVYARLKAGTTFSNGKIVIKTNATVTEHNLGNLFNLHGSNWHTYSKEWAVNPDDGEVWEWADIDALQIGINLQRAGYCTQMYVEVYSTGLGWGLGWSYGDKSYAPRVEKGEYYTCAFENVWEVLDLGVLNIPPIAESDIATINTFQLRIYQTALGVLDGDERDWELDYIFLLPVDEGVVIIDDVAAADVIAIDGITDPPNVFILSAADKIEDYPDYVGKPFSLGRESTRIYVLRDDVKGVTFASDLKYQPQFLVV